MDQITFENNRGLALAGNYWEASSNKGVVMAHGFTGNKQEWGKFTEVAEKLNSAGFNVLAFDFSGCGESDDDTITTEKEIDDLESAIDFIRSQGVECIGVLGLSQGGLVTLETYKQRKDDVSSLILLAPLTDALPDYRKKYLSGGQRKQLKEESYAVRTRDIGERDEFIMPEKLISKKENLDQDRVLEDIDCPILFIHGTEDDVVPIKHSEKAVEKLEGAKLEKIEDGHGWEKSVEKVADLSVEWFKQSLI